MFWKKKQKKLNKTLKYDDTEYDYGRKEEVISLDAEFVHPQIYNSEKNPNARQPDQSNDLLEEPRRASRLITRCSNTKKNHILESVRKSKKKIPRKIPK